MALAAVFCRCWYIVAIGLIVSIVIIAFITVAAVYGGGGCMRVDQGG